MERIRPLTASITGIDGAGKSTVADIVTSRMSPDISIAKISRPVYSVVQGEKRLRYRGLMHAVDVLHGFGDEHQSRKLSLSANAVDVFLQGRIIEPSLIRKIKPQLVLGTRDYLIDPSVYATYYSSILGQKPMDERLDFFRRLTGSEFRDVVFFLTVPPDVAVSRIEKRIAEEAMGQQSTRPKWKHMHERAEHLGRLQEEYYAAIDTASKKGAKEIHEIDTSNSSQHEVADFILSTLNDLLT